MALRIVTEKGSATNRRCSEINQATQKARLLRMAICGLENQELPLTPEEVESLMLVAFELESALASACCERRIGE